ncbi:dihydroxyacetone kinase phosphoryl donor subunit DhaM [Aquibacillus salsiterrae]|uniref:phosphoenolpyruvate--glycerone phosphotransferase n=1 Tax=Aquibacillus salsiterrae TaxID=2950439 RepID=A0A9X4AED4_9BACI|nr:dihydroxyacetone kinase phosphoryl donor subunit DhaM [Aquibacillus salsiterrae]MDC3416636.1 dihydroxyacetone kinase phosphoryl donor subunit DhaM [Aquibacillus salsiterrae]
MSSVGIVLISHSSKIVDGVYDLISQVMTDVPISVAGGTNDGEIGTSIDKILAAIEEVYNEKGVLLLYDLGSAMMNAELAVELSGYENIIVGENVPLVEGGYVAAVESSMGKTLEEVYAAVKTI